MFQALDDSYEESSRKDSEVSWTDNGLRNSMKYVKVKALQDSVLYAILYSRIE